MSEPAIPGAQQLRLRENQVFLILTIVIGVVCGLSAVLFTVAIEQTSHRLFGLAPSRLRLFAIPPLMSIVTGILLAKVFPDVRGSGVPQTETAYHLHGGVIPTRVPFGKFLTGVLCIGSGHSMGREGPSVQIGAGPRLADWTLAAVCRRSGSGTSCRSARPEPCRRPSTRRSPPCCSRSRKSSAT